MFTCWLEYPPKLAVANLVNSLKGVSVRLLRKERPDILKRYCKAVLWSASCFASSCGGAAILIVRQYIEQQQTPQPKDGYAVRAPNRGACRAPGQTDLEQAASRAEDRYGAELIGDDKCGVE